MAKLDAYSTTSFVGTQIKRLAEEGSNAYSADQIATTNAVSATPRDDAARWAARIAVAGKDYGVAADGSTDDAPAINAILAALAERGGGIVELPPGNIRVGSTIDNKYQRVVVQGYGPSIMHDGGSIAAPFPENSTRLVPTFTGTVLKHRTPYGASNLKFYGGGFKDVFVFGNGVATRLLEVDSINGGIYSLYLQDCVGTEAAYFKCGRSFVDLAERCDVQDARVELNVRQLGSGAPLSCKGIVFDGTVGYSGVGTFANFSFNWVKAFVQYANAAAFEILSADNNYFELKGSRAGGGTGALLVCRGATDAHPVGADSNIFTRISGPGGSISAEGTDTPGVTAGVSNVIQFLDTGNATAEPTAGTGSNWYIQRLINGVYSGVAHSGSAIFANSVVAAAAERANTGTESVRVYNSASNHVVLANDSAHSWGVHIDGTNGNLRISRGGGSGAVNIGNGTRVFTYGQFAIGNSARLSFENASLVEQCNIRSGTGTPEGAVTAPVGSLFLRTDGGASTTLYVKESGTGNTGWVAK